MADANTKLSALDVAKWFINATDRESGDAITHLKVQKLLYYAQGWHLAHFDRPLFGDDLQAWAHGPVAATVWNAFRECGYEALPPQKVTRKVGNEVDGFLTSVNDEYGIYTAKRLERMTHEESPWMNARGGLPPEARCNTVITLDDMKAHFKSL